jgi:hypothetical protein
MSKYQCATCFTVEELDITITLGVQKCDCGGLMSEPLWISDNGDVTCEPHSGAYLRCAIEAKPKAIKHKTPLGDWCLYFTHLLGGENLVCETCVPWDSPEHPSNKMKAGA